MKVKIVKIWFVLLFGYILMGAKFPNIDSKKVLSQISPSLVKVVAENHKRYIASGVALEKDLIITSNLILRHNPDKIEVIDVKGNKYRASVKGSDKVNSLLLLKVEKGNFNSAKVIKNVDIGENVLLAGVFYDNFPSVFEGIISSATSRELMINAPVAPGASGGAIINDKGQLLGIIRGTLSYSSEPDISFIEEGRELLLSSRRRGGNRICFGIPMNKVIIIKNKIKKYGDIKKGWLGVTLKREGFKELVTYVAKDSPAYKAGIKEGDKIISMEGKIFDNQNDLITLMRDVYAGETIALNIKREGRTIKKKIKLEERKKSNFGRIYIKRGGGEMSNFSIPSIDKHIIVYNNYKSIGVEVINLNEKLAKGLGVKQGYGLMVKRVDDNSPAEKSGIKEADIIFAVNNNPVKSISLLRDYINKFGDKELHIKAYRKGKKINFNVKADKSESSVFYKNIEKMRSKLQNLYGAKEIEELRKQQRELRKLQSNELDKIKKELQAQQREELKKMKKEMQKLREEEYRRKEEIKKQKEKGIKNKL